MKRLTCIFIVPGLLIALSSGEGINRNEQSDNRRSDPIIADFEKKLNKEVANDTTGSIAALIFKGDEIIWSKAFGKADNARSINADTSTIYRIGSISKSITCYVMMMMVQKGTIHLDDPVAMYLPEIKQLQQDGNDLAGTITFRQLASHSSGLPREPALHNASAGPVKEWENKVLLSIPTTTLHPPIGKNFLYSNIGYGILGVALSRAAHQPFINLVEEFVFRAHGMSNSFYNIPQGLESRIATGYHWNASSKTYSTSESRQELSGRGFRVPNGGVFTTLADMARFAMAFTSNADPLDKNNREIMQTIQISTGSERGYGLGLMIVDDKQADKIVNHNGAVAGFNAYMAFNPSSRVGIIVFRNRDNAFPFIELEANEVLRKLMKENK